MLRSQYLREAIRSQAIYHLEWLIRIFTYTKDYPTLAQVQQETNIDLVYPYRLCLDNTQVGFYNNGVFTPIDDAPTDRTLFTPTDGIKLTAGDLDNLSQDIVASVGNVIFNLYTLCIPFKDKVPYLSGRVKLEDVINTLIINRLVDTPDDSAVREYGPTAPIYADEYQRHIESTLHLDGINYIIAPTLSEKLVRAAPGAMELKAKLFKQFEGQLDDLAVIAHISEQLRAYDKAYIGDDGFVAGSGSKINVTRQKMYYMHGVERGLDSEGSYTLIPNSLNEGWDPKLIPKGAESAREGSAYRGLYTALGGTKVKAILRAANSILIEAEDCGNRTGVPKKVTKAHRNKYIFVNNEQILLTDANIKTYLGTIQHFRNPRWCKATKPVTTTNQNKVELKTNALGRQVTKHGNNFCVYCMGENFRGRPTGFSLAASTLASDTMLIFMKRMHGTALVTFPLNPIAFLR